MPVTRMTVAAIAAESVDGGRRRRQTPAFARLSIAGARAAIIGSALAGRHPHRTVLGRRAEAGAHEAPGSP